MTTASSSPRYKYNPYSPTPEITVLGFNMPVWWKIADHLHDPNRLDLLVFSLTDKSSHRFTTPLDMSSNVSAVGFYFWIKEWRQLSALFLQHLLLTDDKDHMWGLPITLCCRCSSLHCSCSILRRHLGLGHGNLTVMNLLRAVSFDIPVSFSVAHDSIFRPRTIHSISLLSRSTKESVTGSRESSPTWAGSSSFPPPHWTRAFISRK